MIEKIPFGKTGHNSSRIIFGGFAVANVKQDRADEIVDLLLESGINHIDTAPTYGEAEQRIGPWMRRYREEFFLATKTGERKREAAYDEIQRSLNKLQVDMIDLIQFHNLVDPAEWETVFDEGGALEAAIEAQEKGYVRFVGVTGHGITVAHRHLLSLEQYAFDSVLLPYNYESMHNDGRYPEEFEALYETCQEKGVAMQTIKSVAKGRWEDKKQDRNTWYEPMVVQEEVDAAVAYVLDREGVFLNSAGDPDLLPLTISAAERYFDGDRPDNPNEILERMALRPLFTTTDKI